MCRLFASRSAVPSRAHRSLVLAENALAEQSRAHPDGWGIGWFVDDDAYLVKSATPAHACGRFREISGRLLSNTFVVHVRRATIGAIDPLNAHPFRFGRWLFAHNGTVHRFDALRDWMLARTHPKLAMNLVGETDSEHLFAFLLTRLAEAGVDPSGHVPSEGWAAAGALRTGLFTLDAEARDRGLPRPTTNVVLTDGRSLLAHRAGNPLHLSTQQRDARGPRRGANGRVNHLIVASEPTGPEDRWEEIADGATVVLDEGFRFRLIAPVAGWECPKQAAA